MKNKKVRVDMGRVGISMQLLSLFLFVAVMLDKNELTTADSLFVMFTVVVFVAGFGATLYDSIVEL